MKSLFGFRALYLGIKNFISFLIFLLLELCTHKWFKASLFAIITAVVIDNKDALVDSFEEYKVPSTLVLFALYWLRFFIPEKLPKVSFQQSTYQKLVWKDLKNRKGVSAVGFTGSINEGSGFHVVWELEHPLRAVPIIGVRKYRLCKMYQELDYEPFIESYANTPQSIDRLKFKILIRIKKSHGVPVRVENIDDIFSELEIVADARPFGPNVIYERIIALFSEKLKNSPMTGWLC